MGTHERSTPVDGWRRAVRAAIFLIAALALIVALRRWVHHAQLESVPVIVPDDVASADVVSPPARTIVSRMWRDIVDAVSPPARQRLAVLTFDDGPFPVTTPLLLAQLHELGVPAAFFLIGRDTTEQPAIAIRIARAGIEIGNHTQTHPEMASLPMSEQVTEIERAGQAIQDVTGLRPVYFRPPHGGYDAATIDAARTEHTTVVLWDVDPGDWRSMTADTIAGDVVSQARSPAIILLHNGKFATVQALPRIVRAYRAAGFQFVTLSQLQARMPLSTINDPIRVKT